MAIFTKDLSGSARMRLELTVTEISQDISTNTTLVGWSLRIYETTDYGSYYLDNDRPWSVNLDGVQVASGVTNWDFRPAGANSKTIASGQRTISHDADGKKTLACSASFTGSPLSGSGTASGSITLTQILRGRVAIGQTNGVPIVGEVYVGDENGVPRKALEVWVGDANSVPRRSIT